MSKKAQEAASRFNVEAEIDFNPVFHASGFSFPEWPVITAEEPGKLNLFNWGLIPFWVKDEEQAKQMRARTLNAKSETVFEKPSFRSAIHKQRCIVISTGFFEWQDCNKKKYPYFIRLKGQEIFGLAGIYSRWTDKNTGEIFRTFSILTTHANPLMAKIHNLKERMPVVLPPLKENDWINPDLTDEQIKSFFPAVDERIMEAHTISKLITSRTESPNVPAVTERYQYPELVE